MNAESHRAGRAVVRHVILSSLIYLAIAWTVFFHEGANSGMSRFWPPAEVYANYVATGKTGLFAFPLFLFGYLFPLLSVFDWVRVWRRERKKPSEGRAN
jgi:hypothetical protein